jgi:methyltransferase
LLELWLAQQNYRRAKAAGAQEFGAGHYPLFFGLHIGWMVGWSLEGWRRGGRLNRAWPLWLSVFIAAQGLRYWCITSLGRYWNTRILVIPGAAIIRRGPYRWLNHPNYLAVALELLSVPLLFNAWLTALVATVLNAALLLGLRIPAEEKALELLKK